MNNSYEIEFFRALLTTLVVEVPVFICFVKYSYKIKEFKIGKIIFIGILASTLTLPYLWFVLPAFLSDRTVYFIVGETAIVLIEALIYHQLLRLSFKKALIVSLVANLASIIVGLWIF